MTSILSELDQLLNQESTSLNELNYMLRQLEADETAPPQNYTENKETKAWRVLDFFGTTVEI